MARTATGASLTERHRVAQLAIRARTIQDFTRLWPLWRGDARSFQNLIAATIPLIRAHHQHSAAVASAYYEAFRKAERVGGRAAPRIAGDINTAAVAGSLFVTGQQMTDKAIRAGFSPQAAMQNALVRTSGTVTRFALDGGRETVIASTATDTEAKGWTRVTSGDPCAFCAVIASRGPVFSESSADFQAHDHCGCGAEPAYAGSEWPGRAQEFKDLYNQHAAGTENPINAMRQALAGQT